jgi:DNA-binding MarR family transcriptional regulator
VPSTEDRRLVSLELTEAGTTLMAELFPEFNAAESQLVAGISDDELTVLTSSLRHIVNTAEQL